MDRRGRTVESGRNTSSSMVLPAVVLVLTLALGAAASLRFGADSESPELSDNVPATADAVVESPQAAPVVVASETTPDPDGPSALATPMPEAASTVVAQPAGVEPEAPVAFVPAPEVIVPEGRAGLVEALRRGELRPGSRADIDRWLAAARASGESINAERLHGGMMDVFVIENDFTVPAGLSGAHAVIFVLDGGKPFPRGDLGHSLILDVGSGGCIGATCSIMLSR